MSNADPVSVSWWWNDHVFGCGFCGQWWRIGEETQHAPDCSWVRSFRFFPDDPPQPDPETPEHEDARWERLARRYGSKHP